MAPTQTQIFKIKWKTNGKKLEFKHLLFIVESGISDTEVSQGKIYWKEIVFGEWKKVYYCGFDKKSKKQKTWKAFECSLFVKLLLV